MLWEVLRPRRGASAGRTDRAEGCKGLNLDPVLFAAANSSNGVMGKMISPRTIATRVSVTDLP
jgi:hypothetical protein